MTNAFSLSALEHATGGLWPYLVVIIFGFLPTEVWRVLGVVVGKGLDERSEIFHWVRMVSTALVTAVVAKLILAPTGALAFIPLWGRAGAMLLGLFAMVIVRRSIVVGLVVGEIALISAGYLATM
jgi:Branched-chain amino acid transport protein (AzlD)